MKYKFAIILMYLSIQIIYICCWLVDCKSELNLLLKYILLIFKYSNHYLYSHTNVLCMSFYATKKMINLFFAIL